MTWRVFARALSLGGGAEKRVGKAEAGSGVRGGPTRGSKGEKGRRSEKEEFSGYVFAAVVVVAPAAAASTREGGAGAARAGSEAKRADTRANTTPVMKAS